MEEAVTSRGLSAQQADRNQVHPPKGVSHITSRQHDDVDTAYDPQNARIEAAPAKINSPYNNTGSVHDGTRLVDSGPSHSEDPAVPWRRTDMDIERAPIEDRAATKKYLIRRPRPLQVSQDGLVIELGDHGMLDLGTGTARRDTVAHENHSTAHEKAGLQERDTVKSSVQRGKRQSMRSGRNKLKQILPERLDLFIDLLWIGIISNISEHFYEKVFAENANVSNAIAEFIVLFLPALRMWVALQMFLNSYFMDDILQRLLIIWVLILGLVWGNNAPYFLDSSDRANFVIITYILAVDSLLLAELIYSIWIPWLRRQFLVTAVLLVPSTALWITLAIVDSEQVKIKLLIAAIVWDYASSTIFQSPIGSRLLGKGPQKAQDARHTIGRHENFFIIVLGEGVFLLVRGSPLERGLSEQLGRGVLAFIIYFNLNWLYFNGDHARKFTHAAYRNWYTKILWHL